MPSDIEKYPHPFVTADIAIFHSGNHGIKILLVKRKNDPYKDQWVLPGGFSEPSETIEETAARELREETGLQGIKLSQVAVFSTPGRDPRGWIMSVLHTAVVPHHLIDTVVSGDDAADAKWWGVKPEKDNYLYTYNSDMIIKLGFDHDLMVAAALSFVHTQRIGQLQY
jgi:8-oxo-dGTP diphosphatase